MSTTIGFGYMIRDSDPFIELKSTAERFGYGLLKGIDSAESDVKSGLAVAQRNEGWEQLLFLQSPIEGKTSLAFGIQEELTALETTGACPQFFNLLHELPKLAQQCKKFAIFFASEWYESDRVRFSYGSAENLIMLLSMPGHWGIRYMIPETGRLQDSDEIPFIFDLDLK